MRCLIVPPKGYLSGNLISNSNGIDYQRCCRTQAIKQARMVLYIGWFLIALILTESKHLIA